MVSTSPRECKWLVPRHVSLSGILRAAGAGWGGGGGGTGAHPPPPPPSCFELG